jgi:hypothetical protein
VSGPYGGTGVEFPKERWNEPLRDPLGEILGSKPERIMANNEAWASAGV